MTRKEKIQKRALEILEENPEGVRYSKLKKELSKEFSEYPINTIHGSIWNLDTVFPKKVYKPARGLFKHLKYKDIDIEERPEKKKKINEEDFYQPFADWLVNEIEDCTKAIPLGGNKFRDKWGTPDVIGIREPSRSDIIKGPTEITSAEIKTDTKDLITAFGQACAYKLFSHKSYIVIPKDSSEEDISRLDSLCIIFGIGLILFDRSKPDDPQFEIRVRPIKHEPDMFYANKYMKLVENELF